MKTSVHRQILPSLIVLSMFLLSHVALATTVQVTVGPNGDMSFDPDPVFIQPGDTVQWTWGSDFHSVTSGPPGQPDGMFDTDIQERPFMFSFTFPNAGSFAYFCLVHEPVMVGTVVVSTST